MRKTGLIFAVFVVGIATAGVYKWVDEKGKTHYSDTPPTSSAAEQMEPLPQPSSREVERAQQRFQKLRDSVKQMEEDRKQRSDERRNRKLRTISPGNLVPGPTKAAPGLQKDTLNQLILYESAFRPKCKTPRVVETKVIQPLSQKQFLSGVLVKGKWVERWSMDSCGTLVTYRIEYTADGRGGTFIGVRVPPELP